MPGIPGMKGKTKMKQYFESGILFWKQILKSFSPQVCRQVGFRFIFGACDLNQ